MNSKDFKTLLEEELARRCEANPRYSLRAFARFLGVSPSYLSMALNAQRTLAPATVKRLATKLGLSPREIAESQNMAFKQIEQDNFHLISDWYHYAILELVGLDDFEPKAAWVARRLGINVAQTRAAVSRLVRLGLLEAPAQGAWKNVSGNNTNVDNELVVRARRNLQSQILKMAMQALEEIPIEQRDQSSMTMAIDSSLLPEARKKVAAFRRELTQFLESGARKDHVYHLSLSLYPVTHKRGKA